MISLKKIAMSKDVLRSEFVTFKVIFSHKHMKFISITFFITENKKSFKRMVF